MIAASENLRRTVAAVETGRARTVAATDTGRRPFAAHHPRVFPSARSATAWRRRVVGGAVCRRGMSAPRDTAKPEVERNELPAATSVCVIHGVR